MLDPRPQVRLRVPRFLDELAGLVGTVSPTNGGVGPRRVSGLCSSFAVYFVPWFFGRVCSLSVCWRMLARHVFGQIWMCVPGIFTDASATSSRLDLADALPPLRLLLLLLQFLFHLGIANCYCYCHCYCYSHCSLRFQRARPSLVYCYCYCYCYCHCI